MSLSSSSTVLVWFPRLNTEQFFDLESDPGESTDLINDYTWKELIDLWRSRLIKELEPRKAGWVKDGKLTCPPGEHVFSPYKDKRWIPE